MVFFVQLKSSMLALRSIKASFVNFQRLIEEGDLSIIII